MQRRRRINPKEDAKFHVDNERDKVGLDVKYISAFKGRGIFTSITFEKGDFLLEYRGELISKQECERRQRLYHDNLKVFMFEFQFNGKLWCVDAAREDGSLGRLVNDDHINPNAKMKFMTVKGKPHLCLFAVRDISPGEEITYDYGDSDWPWRYKKPGGKSSEGQHGGAPSTSKPSTVTQRQSRRGLEKKVSAGVSFCHPQSFDRVTTESSQTETSVNKPKLKSDFNSNQTSPELGDACTSRQDLDEDMLEEIPEAMNASSEENFEEVTTESSQTETSVNKPKLKSGINLNQTTSAVGDICSERQYQDKDIQREITETMNSPSTAEDFEEMVTESIQTETTVSKPQLRSDVKANQTSPALGELCTGEQITTENSQDQITSPTQMVPVLNSEMCQKHQLVCTTISSLDKCLQCVGPVSSFKWLGYKCKVCSGIWHKSCLGRIRNDNFQHSLQEQYTSGGSEDEVLSEDDSVLHSELDQLSYRNQNISDEEYVPDSQDDDECSDASLCSMRGQLTARQIQKKPIKPKDGKSNETGTSIPVLPSTSKVLPPVEDRTVPNASETLHSANSVKDSSKDMPEGEADLSNEESTPLTMSTKNYCYVCGKPQSKISRHLKTHTTEAEIAHVFSLPVHSKERKIMLEKLRNKGNFRHNTSVLQDGKGPLKVKRKTKTGVVKGKFIHCMHCQGMYNRKELWRHVRKCPCKPENEDMNEGPGRTKVLGMAVALESASCQQISSGVWKLLSVMKQDDIASVVRNDWSVIQFAQSLYNRHGQDPTKYEYIRQKLREVGRLLLCLRSDFSVHNLEEAVKPANFQRVVQAVKKVSGFNEETHSYKTPSLALKLGHTLGKICDIIHCRALMAEDEDLIRSTDIFKKLHNSKWSELVSHNALSTLSDAKYNKPSTLPFTEDVQVFHQYLERSAESAFFNLKEEVTTQNYSHLAQVTLAQIIVFNRRRAGEVSKMRLKSFLERDNTKLHEDVAMGLSKIEQKLCNYFSRIEIMGKRGRKVAVLLTPSIVDALSLLVSKRTECDVCDTNVFLFARPKSMSHYRGQDCLRVHASQCGAKHPEFLRSTQLRKHVATLSQVLNLKNNELDQVADFLGHDIRVHRDFYRLPAPTTQLAKISKLLLSLEKGNLSSLQGKSLEEIEVEDEIMLSDAEAKDSESESEDDSGITSAAPECGTSEPEDAASNSINTQQVHDTGDYEETVSVVTSTVNETVPLSEGKNADQKNEARRVSKKPWSKAEVAAVMRHFRDHISKGKLATKNECSHCKLVECSALAQRTVQNIRDFVRNRGIAAKRHSKSEKM